MRSKEGLILKLSQLIKYYMRKTLKEKYAKNEHSMNAYILLYTLAFTWKKLDICRCPDILFQMGFLLQITHFLWKIPPLQYLLRRSLWYQSNIYEKTFLKYISDKIFLKCFVYISERFFKKVPYLYSIVGSPLY